MNEPTSASHTGTGPEGMQPSPSLLSPTDLFSPNHNTFHIEKVFNIMHFPDAKITPKS